MSILSQAFATPTGRPTLDFWHFLKSRIQQRYDELLLVALQAVNVGVEALLGSPRQPEADLVFWDLDSTVFITVIRYITVLQVELKG